MTTKLERINTIGDDIKWIKRHEEAHGVLVDETVDDLIFLHDAYYQLADAALQCIGDVLGTDGHVSTRTLYALDDLRRSITKGVVPRQDEQVVS